LLSVSLANVSGGLGATLNGLMSIFRVGGGERARGRDGAGLLTLLAPLR
jgi:hypothetical protein